MFLLWSTCHRRFVSVFPFLCPSSAPVTHMCWKKTITKSKDAGMHVIPACQRHHQQQILLFTVQTWTLVQGLWVTVSWLWTGEACLCWAVRNTRMCGREGTASTQVVSGWCGVAEWGLTQNLMIKTEPGCLTAIPYPKHVCKQVNKFWSMLLCKSVQWKAEGLSQWQSWCVCGCDWCYHSTVTRVNLTNLFPVWGEIFCYDAFLSILFKLGWRRWTCPLQDVNPLWINTAFAQTKCLFFCSPKKGELLPNCWERRDCANNTAGNNKKCRDWLSFSPLWDQTDCHS